MIQKIDLEQNNVLGLRLKGKLDHETATAFMDELKSEYESVKHFRLYLEMDHIDDVEFSAIWESLKFLVSHFGEYRSKLERIAVVSDERWVRRAAEIENKLLPGITEKAFSFADKDIARDWIREFRPDLTM